MPRLLDLIETAQLASVKCLQEAHIHESRQVQLITEEIHYGTLASSSYLPHSPRLPPSSHLRTQHSAPRPLTRMLP